MLDPVQTTNFGYDRLNRQTTKTLSDLMGSTTFTSVFDGLGNLLSIADPTTGTVGYKYDSVNRLEWLDEPGGARTTFGYDQAYRRNKINYPNGVVQTTSYDLDGKVASVVGTKGAAVLTSFVYDYKNPAGKETSMAYKMTDPSGVTNYQYDQMERLTQAAGPGGTFNYTVDGNANRIKSSVNGGAETFYAVNAADQLCHSASSQAACGSAPAGAQTYQYDANGNLSGQSDGRALTYNSKDQNISFKPAGLLAQPVPMAYLNSGQTERTQAGGSTFKNGPMGLSINSTDPILPTTYVRTPEGDLVSMRTGGSAHYYLFDRLGSVVALTDSAGSPVNRYFYDPFGNYETGTTELVANPWQFVGGFKDAFSGYYKFGARYYDPTIGRWTQPDPSGQDANSYAYAGGNPVNFVDLSGLKKSGLLSKIWTNKSLLAGLGGVFACVAIAAVCGAAGLFSLGVSLFDSAERNFAQLRRGQYRQFLTEAGISLVFSRIPVARLAKRAGAFFQEPGIRSSVNLYGGLYSVGVEQLAGYVSTN